MHILYLHQYFCPPGGRGNNRSFELARAWVEAGHAVTFVTSAAYYPAEMQRELPFWEEEVEGMRLLVVNVPYAHGMGFRQRVRAWLNFYRRAMPVGRRLDGVDLIYASSTPLTVGELGRRLSRKLRVPYIYECVDVWPDVPIGMGVVRNPLLIRWLHARTQRIYRDAAEIVTLSEGMAEQILAHPVPKTKVHVLHNGCNLDAFPFQVREAGPVLKVIYTGTVGLANGVDALVRVAAMLRDCGRNDLQFLILGGGNDLDRVKALAKAAHLENLTFLAPVPKEEVAGILNEADIGIVTFAPHPVLEANSANKFYDYLASGLPVVLNYQGWQAEYLRNWACGLAAPMGDDEALLNNILRLADDPALRSSMGRNGRKLVEAKFDRKEIALRLLKRFAQVLAQ